MGNDKVSKLENDLKFKKKVFGRVVWKNYAIFPPIIVLFGGILGIVYLMNIDKLVSLYVIPFVVVFALGTVWLKATRRFLIKQKMDSREPMAISLAIPFKEVGGNIFLLFSTGRNRNNKYFLEKEKNDLLIGSEIDLKKVSTKPFCIDNGDLYLVRLPFSKRLIKSRYVIDGNFWLVYLGKGTPYYLTGDMMRKRS